MSKNEIKNGTLLSRVINDDCLNVLPHIEDKSIDIILCDLPFGITKLGWDEVIPVDILWPHYMRIIKDNGAICLFGVEPFSSHLRLSNLEHYRYDLIWNKSKGSNPLLASKRPMSSHENISVFYKSQPVYNPQFTEGKPYKAPRTGGCHTNSIVGNNKPRGKFSQKDNQGVRYPLSVLDFSIHCGSKLHPTQKPVDLCKWIINTYTNKFDLVLDNCAGSFTTALAAEETERNWICIEKESKYCDIGSNRLEQLRKEID